VKLICSYTNNVQAGLRCSCWN